MKKSVAGICLCLIALLAPSLVMGQFGMGDGGSILPGMSCLSIGNIQVVPSVKLGYQKMAINLSFPVPVQSEDVNSLIDTLDVKFNDANFWIGSLGVDFLLGKRMEAFVEVSANPPKGASITTNFAGIAAADFFGGNNGWMGWNWSTSRLQWWEINVRGGYNISEQLAFLVGYKADRLSQKLSAPPEPSYAGFFKPDPVVMPLQQDYFGDVKLTTQCPYVGLRVSDDWWNFSVIWSPWLASYNVQMPLRAVFFQLASSPPDFEYILANSENKFSLRGSNGQLIEASGEATCRLINNMSATMWLKGSWLQCRGPGQEESVSAFLDAGVVEGESFSDYYVYPGGGDAISMYTRYLWAVGISGQLSF